MALMLHGVQKKSVYVEGGVVRIVKQGGLLSTERTKTIPIQNIGSVDIKKPGPLIRGYIQFGIAGGRHLNSTYKVTGGAFDAAQDENSILFDGIDNYQIALEMKRYIESYSASTTIPSSSVSAADEALKLKQLLDQGIITYDQFQHKIDQLMK